MPGLDALLINPGNRQAMFGGVSEFATVAQPLGIAMLASYLRERGFSVGILDAEAEGLSAEQAAEEAVRRDPLLVGLTTFTTKMTAAGDILRGIKARAPGIRTALGGHHASAVPERSLREEALDFVVQGEGYVPTEALLTALKSGRALSGRGLPGVWRWDGDAIVRSSPAPLSRDIDAFPLPAWDLLPMGRYKAHHWQTWGIGEPSRFSLVFTSLGCPYHCDFCSVNVVYGRRGARYRSPARVIEDLSVLVERYDVKHVEIIDDIFTLNRERVERICDLLIERKWDLNFWCFSRTNTADPRFLDKMRRAGIRWVALGIEAGNELILDSVFKKQNLGQIKKAVATIRDAGLHVIGNYIFGLADDDHRTMQDTLDLAVELNTEWANFFISMGYPGTRLYEEALARGWVPPRWEQYGFFAPNAMPTPTKRLTSEEILRFRDAAFTAYFSGERYQSMVERKFGPETVDFIRRMLSRRIHRDYERRDSL